ncbi:hypothetical protein [Nocardioides sp. zg-1228]|uniref:hypothetical protein n=1 Tax=Nocardioides sp. zg-1228 TaxID=2763008 RepID=UPI001642ABAB|nr:hypothetical protein [Nocardioides sp. zg-1228]MBC2933041.1 hypothetical protein [Nocardioides sp. zg-1228]QSF56765.1 hypothetical protein JX575_14310 [Nocardioides sp. zg-1228]
MLDRFDVRTVMQDHSRSMTNYNTGRVDVAAKVVLWGLPILVGVLAVYNDYRLENPTAFVPATSLLAGILFGAVGQLISIRARIADSVTLSQNTRLRSHFRESVSGMLLAALSAMIVSLLLGALILMPATSAAHPVAWPRAGIAVTAIVATMGTYMVLLFIISTRRLYASYLEAFENGRALPKRSAMPPVVSTTDVPAAVEQPKRARAAG